MKIFATFYDFLISKLEMNLSQRVLCIFVKKVMLTNLISCFYKLDHYAVNQKNEFFPKLF